MPLDEFFFHKLQKILGGFPEKNQGQRLVVVNYTFFWEVILVGHCGGIIFVGSLHFITFSGTFRFFEDIDIPRTMVLLAVPTVGYRDCTTADAVPRRKIYWQTLPGDANKPVPWLP